MDEWGEMPSREEAARASAASSATFERAQRWLEENSVPVPVFAERVGLESRLVYELVENGQLLAITVNDELLIPLWQLTREGNFIANLDLVFREIAGGPLTVSAWMTSPSCLLEGRTPRKALIVGDVRAVVDTARARER